LAITSILISRREDNETLCAFHEAKELFHKVDYMMVVVSDMKRSVEFYRDRLGLPLHFESEDWTEFKTGETVLALHGGGKPALDGGQGEQPAGTCSIGFNVNDIQVAFNELKSRGITFVMPPTNREGEGIKLAVCLDPDGLPISLAENVRKSD
jgi:catechol 2,3-dioxygenase-like lactoylglutathione lyase family enzyme